MIRFVTTLPRVPGGLIALSAKGLIEAWADVVAVALRSGVWRLPLLYQSGVRYRLEPGHGGGTDYFDLPPSVLRRGWGDCDDLVIWRVGELRALGVPATVRAEWVDRRVHVKVRWPNGAEEDPSEILS